LNIKSYSDFDLEKDMSNVVLSTGFSLHCMEKLDITVRPLNKNSAEKIFVFKKSTAPDIEDWSW